ncbi:hypothetical protein RD055328_06650 [Companilactobacillus sp. RD055328]|uniref:RibT protein n=1 Tax=Companilactobacillus sp. RD055328 TaxID=2916634 RepID=UPI001FC7D835|nr:RibT protein [Companilactobacillus sp. RD055328]GKQ42742.1 hypothetical protein RD055328_06650 [Companilactobacillus sp. RD055328]
MLIPYSEEYKKITMGFLSYRKELKDVDFLTDELRLLQTPKHQLYLYKRGPERDFIGIIATDIGEDFVYVRYLCLNPAYRTGKNIYRIFDDLQNTNKNKHILSSIELSRMTNSWKRDRELTGKNNG